MPEKIDSEYIPVAAAFHAAIGVRPSPATCTRYSTRGIKGRPPLHTILVLGKRCTTVQSVKDWLANKPQSEPQPEDLSKVLSKLDKALATDRRKKSSRERNSKRSI